MVRLKGDDLEPYAEGKVLAVAPESEAQRMTIKSLKGNLQLVDGRIDRKAELVHCKDSHSCRSDQRSY